MSTSWSIAMNPGLGTISQPAPNSIEFMNVANDTYSFTVGTVSGYTSNPSGGSVTVNGADVTVPTITFTAVTYTLQFDESGLPSGISWTVDENGVYMTNTAPTQTFTQSTSSYDWYTYASNSSWGPSPASKSGTISGTSITFDITFSLVTYKATFDESNLPSGTEWSVTVGGVGTSSASAPSSISFSGLTNGSYSFSVTCSNSSYSAPGGSFPIEGGSTSVLVSFTYNAYPVSFEETGLPGGTLWSVTLGGSTNSSTTSTIQFEEPDGTYAWSIGVIPGYQPSSSSGTVKVSGAAKAVVISWTHLMYNVTFSESGITTVTKWWVNISGPVNKSSPANTGVGSYNNMTLPNGTYTYTIASDDKRWEPTPSKGSFTVAGAPLVITITFIDIIEAVTFTESGLPTGMEWWANVSGGNTAASNSSVISYQLPNGTYTYHIQAADHSWAAPGGNFTVAGAPVSIPVSFVIIVFVVTFNETGLASGVDWYVNFSGTTQGATAAPISFIEPNGTYSYAVAPIAGYTTRAGTGNVTVHGHPVNVTIVFHPVNYPITFTESGLPTGSVWWVNISSISSFNNYTAPKGGTLLLPNDSYIYSISCSNKNYTPAVATDTIIVNGTGLTVPVVFLASTYHAVFTESGLPGGSLWQVFLNGTRLPLNGINATSNTSSVTFALTNGTYIYHVALYGSYLPSPRSGNFTVAGMSVLTSVNFTKAQFTVTFVENGLPTGMTWSVTLNGLNKQSSTPTLVFYVTNGTFPYVVQSPGGPIPNPSSGSVYVLGSSPTVVIAFGSSSGGSSGLSASQLALVGGLLASGAIVLVAVIASRRRRPPSAGSAPPSPPGGAVSPANGTPPGSPPPMADSGSGETNPAS